MLPGAPHRKQPAVWFPALHLCTVAGPLWLGQFLGGAPISPCCAQPSIQFRITPWRPAATSDSRREHSHTKSTRHPSVRRASTERWSRSTFAASLTRQNSGRVAGIFANLQPWCWCQKQPWTKMATLLPGRTMSGVPGRSRRCSRKRNPSANSRRRTRTSGREFLPLMPAIIRLRTAEETTSTMCLR